MYALNSAPSQTRRGSAPSALSDPFSPDTDSDRPSPDDAWDPSERPVSGSVARMEEGGDLDPFLDDPLTPGPDKPLTGGHTPLRVLSTPRPSGLDLEPLDAAPAGPGTRGLNTRVKSGALKGVDGYLVEVEVDLVSSLPMFSTVGLAEGAVRESKERVRSAIKNSGFAFPPKRITVNLAPADVPKVGTSFDLPIAIGIMAENGDVQPERLSQYLLLGELALDGQLRPVKGVLPIACMAKRAGLKGILLPEPNAPEAAVVADLEILPVRCLDDVVRFLNDELTLTPCRVDLERIFAQSGTYPADYSDVRGQALARRALEVAAAGGHNLLMLGPPGSGKTMLARRLPSILPPLSFEEALETTKVYSVMGMLPPGRSLVTHRPFRAPHHTISEAGLIGGGNYPLPGEMSLSHNGVLFLDELPEFRRQTLEVMRQPLETAEISLTRSRHAISYPARVMLIATMNPCPCGHLGDTNRQCHCSPTDIVRYRNRLSGPLLDRIDIHVEVPALLKEDLTGLKQAESSSTIKARVLRARALQQRRFEPYQNQGLALYCNAQLTDRLLEEHCELQPDARRALEIAIQRLGLSGRAWSRVLKLARTIADLAGEPTLHKLHVMEAIQYRSLDRYQGDTGQEGRA